MTGTSGVGREAESEIVVLDEERVAGSVTVRVWILRVGTRVVNKTGEGGHDDAKEGEEKAGWK